MRLWDPSTGRAIGGVIPAATGTSGGGVSGVAFRPDGERLASADDTGVIRLWDVSSFEDREQVIDTLKTAFARGRLTRQELDRRVGIVLVSRIYGDLAAVVWGAMVEVRAQKRSREQLPRRSAPRAGADVSHGTASAARAA